MLSGNQIYKENHCSEWNYIMKDWRRTILSSKEIRCNKWSNKQKKLIFCVLRTHLLSSSHLNIKDRETWYRHIHWKLFSHITEYSLVELKESMH
jgi:hypothetical protein